MNSEARDVYRFLQAIHLHPDDRAIHEMFIQWLDELDEPELADEQRALLEERRKRGGRGPNEFWVDEDGVPRCSC